MLTNLAQVFELSRPRRSSRRPWTVQAYRVLSRGNGRMLTEHAAQPRAPRRRTARGAGLADLVGLAPAMALFGVFILVPMLGAVRAQLLPLERPRHPALGRRGELGRSSPATRSRASR